VLLRSRAVPIKQLIASARLPADEQQKIRDALVGLRDAKGGKEVLDSVGYRGFVVPNPEVEASTIAWLGL
jgi:ABC-type phosphate/phosphonate transport system substrate-binding protein